MTFVKGQSGNPSGRPKELITKHLRARSEVEGKQLADVLWNAAIAGDVKAAALVLDRVDGKVPDEVKNGGVVRVLVEYVNDARR